MTEPRAIEEFLKPAEDGYNDAVAALENGEITGDVVYAISIKRIGFDLRFRQFTQSRRNLSRHEVVDINRKLVQGAERLVFSNHEREWVPNFIAKNRNYRIEISQTAHLNDRNNSLLDRHISPLERPR